MLDAMTGRAIPDSPLADALARGRFPVSLEITPPRSERLELLFRRAAALGPLPAIFNVIQRADRWNSVEAAGRLERSGRAAIGHVAIRGRSERDLRSELARAAAERLAGLLCLPGDHAHPAAGPRIRDVVAWAARALPTTPIGVTLNQNAEPARALANLLPKLDAGASFVQTQPVFDVEALEVLLAKARASHPALRAIPIVMPLLSRERADALCKRPGVSVPEVLLERLATRGAEAGWEAFAEVSQELALDPGIDGLAVMTFEADPPAEIAERIAEVIADARTRRERAGLLRQDRASMRV